MTSRLISVPVGVDVFTPTGEGRVRSMIAKNGGGLLLAGLDEEMDSSEGGRWMELTPTGRPAPERFSTAAKPSEGGRLRAWAAKRGRDVLAWDVDAGVVTLGVLTPLERRIRAAASAFLKTQPQELTVTLDWTTSEDLTVSLTSVALGGLPPFVSEEKARVVLRECMMSAVPEATSGWAVDYDALRDAVTFTPGAALTLPDLAPADIDAILDPSHRWRLPYGVDARGDEVAWDVTEEPMAGVFARTGCGKTVSIYAIAAAALARGWDFAVCEVSKEGGDFTDLRPWVMEGGWGCDSKEHASQTIQNLYAMKGARMRAINSAGHKKLHSMSPEAMAEAGLRPVLLVIDEAAALFAMPPVIKGLPKDHPRALAVQREQVAVALAGDAVRRISAELRAVGIHMLVSSQRFEAALFAPAGGGTLRAQLGHRVVLGTMSRTTLGMHVEMPDTAASPYAIAHGASLSDDAGADALKPRPGRGIVETSTRTVPVQCVYAAETRWVEALLERGLPTPGGSAPELSDELRDPNAPKAAPSERESGSDWDLGEGVEW